MKMDVALFLLAFTLFWKSSQSIRCYKCEPERITETGLNCQQFNGTSRFMVDCESSTMCFKRVMRLNIGNELTTNVERGCAAQTVDGDQRKIGGKWVQVHDIYEVYAESCEETTNDYQRVTNTIDCYCRGELCNSATKNGLTYIMLIGTAIFILVR